MSHCNCFNGIRTSDNFSVLSWVAVCQRNKLRVCANGCYKQLTCCDDCKNNRPRILVLVFYGSKALNITLNKMYRDSHQNNNKTFFRARAEHWWAKSLQWVLDLL